MNELHFSDNAKNELVEIKRYIAVELENPGSALATVKRIRDKIKVLQRFAYAGPSLSSHNANIVIDTAYRYLTCGVYVIVYHVNLCDVYIDHIFNAKQDYFRTLFPEIFDTPSN